MEIPSNGHKPLPLEFVDLDIKQLNWIDWDQVTFGIYNRKGTIATSLRKGTPYILRILMSSRVKTPIKQVRNCSNVSEFNSLDSTLNLCTFLRVSQLLGGQNITAEISGVHLRSVVRWGDEKKELSPDIEETPQGLVIGLPFIFLKNRKEICDLDLCSNIPSKHNAKRVYSFIIILSFGLILREYKVDIPWKGMNERSNAVPAAKRTKLNSGPHPSCLEDIVPSSPSKKYKSESNSNGLTPLILSVVPIMCDVGLAEIQQQITSIIGQNLPTNIRLLFGTVPAIGHLVPHVFYVPRLSQIPIQYINHQPESKGTVVLEKYFVPLEALTEDDKIIPFQGVELSQVPSLWFMYQGTSDVMMSQILWNKQEVKEEDNGFTFDFDIPDSDTIRVENLNYNYDSFSSGFEHSFILSEPIILHVLEYRTKHKIPLNPSITDMFGRTLLHHVIMKGFHKTTKKLLELGFDLNCKDKFGKTPMEYAVQFSVKITMEEPIHTTIVTMSAPIDILATEKKSLHEENYQNIELDVSAIKARIEVRKKELLLLKMEEKKLRISEKKKEILRRKYEEKNKPIKNEKENISELIQNKVPITVDEKKSQTYDESEIRKKEKNIIVETFSTAFKRVSDSSKDEEADNAELAMKERIVRRKTELAEKQSPKMVRPIIFTPLDSSSNSPISEERESELESHEFQSHASEEENAMKERVVQRKKKLAVKQEKKSEETQKEKTQIDMEKLEEYESIIAESLGISESPDFSEISVEKAMENLSLDNETLLLEAHRKRISDRKRRIAEKEKIQQMERLQAALKEEAAAEAAASALKERIVERKRHLAELERAGFPSDMKKNVQEEIQKFDQ